MTENFSYEFKKYYREIRGVLGLSFSLAKTGFKLRNEGSYLGIFWYLLEPLAFFTILLFIRDVVSQHYIIDYPIYLFIGLIMFNFFTAVTNFSTKVIQSNSGFIKSLRINKEAFVISGLLQFVFSHFFEFLILLAIAVFLHMNILWFIFYIFVFILFCFFTLGVSFVLAVAGVYANDLKNVWSILMRLLWFATPIFYTVAGAGILHKISMLNPLYHFINIPREIIIFHKLPDLSTTLWAITLSVLVFLIGLLIFEKNKNKLAEKI